MFDVSDVIFSENTIGMAKTTKQGRPVRSMCGVRIHSEVRLCNVQLSCVCLWTNGKKLTTNKEDIFSENSSRHRC